jgi:hypothetical protein
MAWRWIVSPCDDDQLVEFETVREFFKARGHLLCRSDYRLAAELLGNGHLRKRIWALGFLGRQERLTDALSAIDHCAFAGFELMPCLFCRIGCQRPDTNRRDRPGVRFAGTIVLAVKLQRLTRVELVLAMTRVKSIGQLASEIS